MQERALMLVVVVLASSGCQGRRGGGPGTPGPIDPNVVPGCTPVDADGDGIADLVEGTGDTDRDGTPNAADDDSDGDGWPDSEEHTSDNPCSPNDSDMDRTWDFLDPDSDNDGLTDAEERTARTDRVGIDTDGDGVTDFGEVHGTMTDPLDPASTIPEGDFFVVLPYNGDRQVRDLRFGTNISVADVFFLMDTTGSMGEELSNIQRAMETVIVPGVQGLVPDVQFGAGGFDDFPVGFHGAGFDLPYYHLIDIVPFVADMGAFTPPSAFGDVGRFVPGPPNGLSDIVEAVRSYPRHGGGNGCESGVEALYQTATGEGVSWGGGSVPPKTCPVSPDEVGLRRGYPCFRPGALPIVVFVSDAPFHEPLPSGWPLDTQETCIYSEVGSAHTYDQALGALRGIGARVVSLSSDSIPSGSSYPATAQMCNLSRDTGAVRGDSSPLCFEIGTDGSDIGTDVVNAIAELVGGTPQDVSTRTQNLVGNPDEFDATLFIKAIVPVEGYQEGIAGEGYSSRDEVAFYGVIPGTQVDFSVDFLNDVREGAEAAEIFRAGIIVVGNAVADLDVRNVYIVVPPDGQIVMII